MGFLRKLYPGAFKLEKKVTKPFVIKLVVYVAIYLIASVILGGISGVIMGVGIALGLDVLYLIGLGLLVIASLLISVYSLYMVGGIVVSILKFVGVIKDQTSDVENTNLNNAAGKVGGAFDKVVNAAENVVNKVVDKATEVKNDDSAKAEEASEETTEADAE